MYVYIFWLLVRINCLLVWLVHKRYAQSDSLCVLKDSTLCLIPLIVKLEVNTKIVDRITLGTGTVKHETQ